MNVISYMYCEKGKMILVNNSFKFYKKYAAKTNIFTCIICVNNKCRSKCYTDRRTKSVINKYYILVKKKSVDEGNFVSV